MLKIIFVYGMAVFLLVYGYLSFRAGIKKEDKQFWLVLGWDDTKRWLKNRHTQAINLVGGLISIVFGIGILIVYRPVV